MFVRSHMAGVVIGVAQGSLRGLLGRSLERTAASEGVRVASPIPGAGWGSFFGAWKSRVRC